MKNPTSPSSDSTKKPEVSSDYSHKKSDSLDFSPFSIPDDSWQSKFQHIFKGIESFTQHISGSRSLQLALVCLLVGISSSAYGIHSLVTDSHLVCQAEDTLAQANQSQGESIDFFDVEASTQSNFLDGIELDSEENSSSDQDSSGSVESGQITVDVSGAIKQPGLYTVPDTNRLGDVIAAAGGLTTQANAQEVAQVLNLASKLADGQKVYIPFSGEDLQSVLQRQAASTSVEAASSKVGTAQSDNDIQSQTEPSPTVTEDSGKAALLSINTASAKELMELKGIGEKRAADIISGRPYDAVTDLLEQGVLTNALFDSLQEFLKL
jgi:competence protein ComEA